MDRRPSAGPASARTRSKGAAMLTTTPFTDLSAQMTGRVVTPSDPDWDATRQVFNLATDLRPAAVALPRDVSDVVAAVGYARANGLRVAPQATGHNADAARVARGRAPRRRSRAPGGLHRPRRPAREGRSRREVGAGRPAALRARAGRAARLVPRRRDRRLLAGRRHGLARPQVRPPDEQRHGDRARHGGRASRRASTRSTSPISSGRFAAATATSASSPRSSSPSTPSRTCTRA